VILAVDAHALLWALHDDGELSEPARRAVADPENDVLVSAATVWEIEVKRAAGRLQAPPDLLATVEATRFTVIPITAAEAVAAARLPPHHRDPFDRMLIAQAMRLDAIIVSRDRAFAPYDVKVLTA
jgi:PIN domain nuclease of toxin-antitoxin system